MNWRENKFEIISIFFGALALLSIVLINVLSSTIATIIGNILVICFLISVFSCISFALFAFYKKRKTRYLQAAKRGE